MQQSFQHLPDSLDKSPWVEFSHNDFVRAIALDRHEVVADERHLLPGVGGAYAGAKTFGLRDSSLPLHVDQHQIECPLLKKRRGVCQGRGAHDAVAVKPQYLVAKLEDVIPASDVENAANLAHGLEDNSIGLKSARKESPKAAGNSDYPTCRNILG